MRCCVYVVALVCALALSTYATDSDTGEDSDVVILTGANYDELISEEKWLVKFYAPWCGHCKHLAPVWEEVATELKDTMNIAKIDCTVDNGPCDANGVRGYPTLKYFNNGKGRTYTGGREKEDFVAFAKKVTGPIVQTVDDANIDSFLRTPDASFLYYSDGVFANDDLIAEVAEDNIDDCSFGSTRSAALMESYGVTDAPALVSINSDGDSSVFPGPFSSEILRTWVSRARYPLLGELTADTARMYRDTTLKTVVGCVDPSDYKENAKFLDALRDAAGDYAQSDFVFAHLNAVRWSQFVEQFGVDSSALPDVFVWDPEEGYYYHVDDLQLDADGVRGLVEGIKSGKIEKQGYGNGAAAEIMKIFGGIFKALSAAFESNPLVVGVSALVFVAMIAGLCCLGDDEPPRPARSATPGTAPAKPETEKKED